MFFEFSIFFVMDERAPITDPDPTSHRKGESNGINGMKSRDILIVPGKSSFRR